MVVEDKTNSSYFTKGHIPNNKGKTGLYHHTDKTKKVLSQINIGRINSRETRIKISKTHKGKKLSAEHIKSIKKGSINKGLGKKLSIEHRNNISKGKKGIPKTQQHKEKIRQTLIKNKIGFTKGCIPFNKGVFGELNHNWKGDKGRTCLALKLRNCFKYRQWRSDIFERDNYVCKFCDKRGGVLNADHIKPFALILKENNIKTFEDGLICEELWNINNGRTLCKPCHEKTDTYGGNKK